jgi:hypothetical protein
VSTLLFVVQPVIIKTAANAAAALGSL